MPPPGPREFSPRKTLIAGSVVLALILWHVLRPPAAPTHVSWSGPTMGTQYRVILPFCPLRDGAMQALRMDIEARLDSINRQMSTWQPESEISRFNDAVTTNAFPVSAEFARVVRMAQSLSAESGGAFDITVGPLVKLWGFGPGAALTNAPAPDVIAATLARTGHARLEVTSRGALRKRHPKLQLDLSAIAKGYAVDELAGVLRSHGLIHYYVEIGGEIVVRGLNREKRPWALGLEPPEYGSLPGDRPHLGVLRLRDGAVAGSGDYRNFFTVGERIYSHIIDPSTGEPVNHTVGAATVVAPNCAMADGLATALMVMGADEGLAMIDRLRDVEAMVVLRTNAGLRARRSAGFAALLADDGAGAVATDQDPSR